MKRLIKQCVLSFVEGNPITLYKKNTTYYILYDFGTLINLISYSSLKEALIDYMKRIQADYRIKRGGNYKITDECWVLVKQHYNKIMEQEYKTRSITAASL